VQKKGWETLLNIIDQFLFRSGGEKRVKLKSSIQLIISTVCGIKEKKKITHQECNVQL